jgi:hypothetical protein
VVCISRAIAIAFTTPSRLALGSDFLNRPGIERSPNGAAQGVTTTPPIVTRSKDNSNPFTQDIYPAEDSNFNSLASGANETPVRVAGPIHYDKWFQDRRVESEEIKLMKRVHLDYTDVDTMGPWPSQAWTRFPSTLSKSQSIDGKASRRRKPAMTAERRKRPKDDSPFLIEPELQADSS